MPVLKVQKADGTYDIIQTSGLSGSEIIVSATQPAGVPDGALWLDTSDNEFQGTIYDNIFDSLNNKLDKLSAVETVTVGSGGDFATINEALVYATTKYPQYVTGATKAEFVINLLSGFVMAEQVIVKGLNLGWIRITGEDAETVIQRSALTEVAGGANPVFFGTFNAYLPQIDQLFNVDTSGSIEDVTGVLLAQASRVTVYPGAGILNCPRDGILATQCSAASITGADFSGSGRYGIYAFSSSAISATSAKVNNVGSTTSHYAVHAAQGSNIDFQSGEAKDCAGIGIYALRESSINASFAVATGAGSRGVFASEDSKVNIRNGNAQKGASPATSDIGVDAGSIVTATGATGGLSQTKNTLTANGIIFQP